MSLETPPFPCAVVQDALRAARAERLKRELHELRQYWTRKAHEKGVLRVCESIQKAAEGKPLWPLLSS